LDWKLYGMGYAAPTLDAVVDNIVVRVVVVGVRVPIFLVANIGDLIDGEFGVGLLGCVASVVLSWVVV